MSAIKDFYLARAAECAAEAQRSPLTNVQDRYLRSEAAWRTMAARVTSTEEMRDRNVANKSATEAGDKAA